MGLGCWAIGGPLQRDGVPVGWGEVDDNESIAAIERGLEMGINFFDTADVYGAGHSERVLGRALAGKRDQVVIATKFFSLFDEETRQASGGDASPDHIRRACHASLARLNTDYIDLYQFHAGDYALDAAVEVRETLEELVTAGKIRAYGWSTDSPERARLFAEGPNCTAVQLQENVFSDNGALLDVCEELNLAAINRGPLAMGLLTGKYGAGSQLGGDDVRGINAPAWMQYFKAGKPAPEWLAMLAAVREILTQDGRTLAQGALGWLWARSEKTVPIPGFRTVAQVEENCAALEKGPLTADQMAEIEQLLGRA